MSVTSGSSGVLAPIAVEDRAMAPDLARGAMLLLIALANAHIYLHGHDIGVRGYPRDLSTADQVMTWAQLSMVDGRAYPLFALLLGYGLVQLTRRFTARGAGEREVVRLLRRRGRWLALLGLLHALLLFSGDVLGAYGLLVVVLAAALVRRSDRWLRLAALWWLLPVALLGLGQGAPLPAGVQSFLPSMGTTHLLVAAGFRLGEWLLLTAFMALGMVAAVLGGAWAARRRVLDEPGQHVRALRTVAVAGLGVALLGAQPTALMAAGVWSEPTVSAMLLAASLHTLSGYAGGVGYACLAGLLAVAWRGRPGRVGAALVACGQRSLSCYLAQSVVFVAVLASYGGGLGDELGVAQVAVVATLTWAATVVLADALARRGLRGPFEVLSRRLTYGGRGLGPAGPPPVPGISTAAPGPAGQRGSATTTPPSSARSQSGSSTYRDTP